MIIHWTSPVTFARAVFRTIQYLVAGRPVLAPGPIQEDRLAACEKCPWHVDSQCVKCTCFVAVKVLLSSESCPDNPPRWKKLTFSKEPPKEPTVS